MMNTIRFARRSIARALCVVALAASAPAAAIPDVVTWAARVENDAGAFNGTMTVTFELFDADTGGAVLWTELLPSAVVVDGDLVHELGSIEPLDDALIDRDNLFLQVTMNGDALAPRTALRAVPYALRSAESAHAEEATHAADATTLAGLAAASFQFTAGAGGGLKLTGTAFAINTSGVVTTMIADGAVTSAKLADGAVTTEKLAAGAVTSTQIGAGAVGNAQLGAGVVNASKLSNNAVTAASIASGAVTSNAIADSSITTFDIRDGTISRADIKRLAVVQTGVDCGTQLVIDDQEDGTVTCKSIACSSSNFFNCAGSCSATSPQSCTFNRNIAGYLVQPD